MRSVRNCASVTTYQSCSTSLFQPLGMLRETVSLLARMARFIIADLTDPSSIPKELEAIVPDLAVPVQPLLEASSRSYVMSKDYWKYDWVLPVYRYEGPEQLLATLAEKVIAPAEGKVRALQERRRMIEAELTKIGINGAFSAQLSRIAQLDQTDCPRGPMSAFGGSGRAAPKEQARVWTQSGKLLHARDLPTARFGEDSVSRERWFGAAGPCWRIGNREPWLVGSCSRF